MTIRNRVLNGRLAALERCAEDAPEGIYERAKEAATAIVEASQAVMDVLREHGFVALNDDWLRNLEVSLYEYLLEGNPADACELSTAEGFGEHVRGRARDRIIANLIRDRDALAHLRAELRRLEQEM